MVCMHLFLSPFSLFNRINSVSMCQFRESQKKREFCRALLVCVCFAYCNSIYFLRMECLSHALSSFRGKKHDGLSDPSVPRRRKHYTCLISSGLKEHLTHFWAPFTMDFFFINSSMWVTVPFPIIVSSL